MSAEALKRARRGAAFLDKTLGRSWRRRIKKRKLDMAESEYRDGGCGCILAQLAPDGDYLTGLEEVGLDVDSRQEWRFGFDGDDYDQLTEAWLTVLREGAKA